MVFFNVDYERASVDGGLGEAQGEWGVTVLWHRWDPNSPTDDIYDVGAPRRWGPGVEVPVQLALVKEGSHTFEDRGLRTVNRLAFAVSKAVLRDRLGWGDELTKTARGHQDFLRDRVSYAGTTFTIDTLEPIGDLQGRDAMISVTAREVPEETLVLDEDPPTPPPDDPYQ